MPRKRTVNGHRCAAHGKRKPALAAVPVCPARKGFSLRRGDCEKRGAVNEETRPRAATGSPQGTNASCPNCMAGVRAGLSRDGVPPGRFELPPLPPEGKIEARCGAKTSQLRPICWVLE